VPTNTERFYKQLSSVRALQALVGKPENADFDCKEWPARQDDARRIIAKAACGFTNATGGVIVIGVKASGAGANTPDVVRNLASVANRHAVASAALDIILQSVEPGIVTSSLSRAAVAAVFANAAQGVQPKPHFVQLYWLLMTYFSACAEVGVVGYVICQP
jgi:hypothetical protein